MVERFAAEKAVLDPRYLAAKNNGFKERRRIRRECEEALSHSTEDDMKNIRMSKHIPWIDQLTNSAKPHFGLVCLRTAYDDDEAWEKYKEHILRTSKIGFSVLSDTDLVSKKWKIDFIGDDKERLDGASLEDMCKSGFPSIPPAWNGLLTCSDISTMRCHLPSPPPLPPGCVVTHFSSPTQAPSLTSNIQPVIPQR